MPEYCALRHRQVGGETLHPAFGQAEHNPQEVRGGGQDDIGVFGESRKGSGQGDGCDGWLAEKGGFYHRAN